MLNVVSRKFNRYRSPECKAKVLRNKDRYLVVEFSGTNISSCCFDEHFEDYRQILEEYKGKFQIEKIEEKIDRFIVYYKKI